MNLSRFAQTALKQVRAQALDQQRRGRAKTQDHLMMQQQGDGNKLYPARISRKNAPGQRGAQWKSHTPEAMIRTAFDLYASCKAKAADGGSKSHAQNCTWVVASVVTSASQKIQRGLKRPLAESVSASGPGGGGAVLDDFHINNNMFDESQLWIKTQGRNGTKKRRRVLAAATQVTRRAPGGSVEDYEVIRTPRTMAAYTAAACAGILGQPTDSAACIPRAMRHPRPSISGVSPPPTPTPSTSS